ncbi:MAG TPA: FHA domain-containing protein [Polyangia bacterium]|nr:FHA domain-containing protein [Polyangia bacterium]
MMPSQYLDEFIRELRREGDKPFRARYATPMLIVTRAEGEMKGSKDTAETTVMADTSGWRIQQVSLLNRVFPITRGAFAKEEPITLGRTAASDIAIPDDSVSKRHCVFEPTASGITVTDCGSTNGTSVGGAALAANEPRALAGGEKIDTGNFSYLFHTADGFLEYLKRVVKT